MFCMCASEDCQIRGCARLRNLPPITNPQVPHGWVCPKCGTVNGPAALTCMGCTPIRSLKVTCGEKP